MKKKERRYDFRLVGLVFIVVPVLVAGLTASADQYIPGSDWYWDWYEDADEGGEVADANGYGYPDGTFWCETKVQTGIVGSGSKYAYAYAYAWYLDDYTWDGAPGDAPGGTLSWSFNGSGGSTALGVTTLWDSNYSALALSDAESGIWGDGTEGSAYGTVEVYGSVWDMEDGEPGGSYDAYPSEDFDPEDPFRSGIMGEYTSLQDWEMSSSGQESIASGTTYVYFHGGVDCDCGSASIASGGVMTLAGSESGSGAGGSASSSFP